jgi:PAS domain S-box-containing protein
MKDPQAAQGPDDAALDERLDAALDRGNEHPFFDDVLEILLTALESPSGVFGQLDEFGDLVCTAQRGAFGSRAEVPVYHARETCVGAWSSTLDSLMPRTLNERQHVLHDGPAIASSLTVPIVFGGEAIGLICIADRERPYGPFDQARLVRVAKRVAPSLFAHNAERRFRRQLADLEHMANAAAEGERFFMLSGDLMAIIEDQIVRANPAFFRHLGWEDSELRDKDLSDLAHPADREVFARDLDRMRREPNREHPALVVRVLAKSGTYRSIEWTGAGTEEGRLYVVGRDVSELRSAVARLAAQNEELHVLHEQVRREQRLAGHLLANVRRQGCLDLPGVRHLTSPLDFFNGDVALAATTPTGELRWMLGDFTGHGLSAAIGTIPVASTFYATSRKGVSLVESLETINDLLKGVLPAGLFCAAAFLGLDPERGELLLWNGGLPAIIVRNGRDGSLRLHASQSLPLGLVASRELEVMFTRIPVDPSDEIFVYTDGLTEAQNSIGELFGQERVAAALSKRGQPGDGFDRLLDELKDHRGTVRPGDDVSLIVVTVGALRIPSQLLSAPGKQPQASARALEREPR